MKTTAVFLMIFSLMLFGSSCEENDCCNLDESSDLIGNFLLIERGYSPGIGYIVTPVSPSPPQTITLHASGEFSTTVQELVDYKYYQVIQDAANDVHILALFEHLPLTAIKYDELKHSYNIVFEDGLVKLYFRFCIEGCHLGFNKMAS